MSSDIIAKCQAMQYGVLIAGLILLVIVGYNWWSDYSNQCLASCKTACATPSANTVSSVPASMPTTATLVTASGTSRFAANKGSLTDQEIQSNFLNYREDDGDIDYYQQFATPGANGTMAYDPARESLEESVFLSHKEFVEDSYISTTGSNASDTLRDDPNDVNKRWGI